MNTFTQWDRKQMAAILKKAFVYSFSFMRIVTWRLNFQWKLSQNAQSTNLCNEFEYSYFEITATYARG